MPMRQIQSSEQHIVIKTQVQSTMNPVNKVPKTAQNGKGPPPEETPSATTNHHTSPPSRNRGRRRGRGGRKSYQGDVVMRPTSRRSCDVDYELVPRCPDGTLSSEIQDGSMEIGAHVCQNEMGFPSSSKSLRFASRPGYGQVGTKCIVKANHFFVELADEDLNQYDVSCIPKRDPSHNL